jgi:soluble lytic murein transglycosylase-like protein
MRDGQKVLPIALVVALLFGVALLAVLVLPSVSEGNAAGVPVVASDASGSPSPEAAESPTATPTPSASPTPEPASLATVKWAQRQRKAAHRAWQRYRHAARCFHKRVVPFFTVTPRYPQRSASESVWRNYGKRYQSKRQSYLKRYQRLRQKMLHPGGSSNGVRWLPLARWVGWPESTLGNLAYIIMRESSGRERALNSSSGAAGLLQFMPPWYHGQWGYPAFDPFNPEANLAAGVWVWKRSGWSPWAL